MNTRAMNIFLSEENINRHLDYFRRLKLKYSILEKSFPFLTSKSLGEVASCNLNRADKFEVMNLLWEIYAHECYFNSFTSQPQRCDKIKAFYSSQDRFVYELYDMSKEQNSGFLFVYLDGKGKPSASISNKPDGAFVKYLPVLALDLCEHSYFADYGFKKDKYIRSALTYFDLSKLNSLDN